LHPHLLPLPVVAHRAWCRRDRAPASPPVRPRRAPQRVRRLPHPRAHPRVVPESCLPVGASFRHRLVAIVYHLRLSAARVVTPVARALVAPRAPTQPAAWVASLQRRSAALRRALVRALAQGRLAQLALVAVAVRV
jgi:hypothetical protein